MSNTEKVNEWDAAKHKEKQLLGALLAYPETMADVSGTIEDVHFCTETHRYLFGQLVGLTKDGHSCDLSTWIKCTNEEQRALAGGISYVSNMMGGFSSLLPEHVALHAKEVVHGGNRRLMMKILREGLNELENGGEFSGVAHNTAKGLKYVFKKEGMTQLSRLLSVPQPSALRGEGPNMPQSDADWKSAWAQSSNFTDRAFVDLFMAAHQGRLSYCDGLPGKTKWLEWGGDWWNVISEVSIIDKIGLFASKMADTVHLTEDTSPDKEAIKRLDKRTAWINMFMSGQRANHAMKVLRSRLENVERVSYSDHINKKVLSVPFKGKTLRVEDGMLTSTEPMPGDYFTTGINYEYRPEETSPKWEKFINEITCGDKSLARYIQKVLGLCLTGDMTPQLFWIFKGSGGDGKGVLMDMMFKILGAGKMADTVPGGTLLAGGKESTGHTDAVAGIAGKRLIVVDETDPGDEINEAFIKRNTGESPTKASFKGGSNFTYMAVAKFIFTTNHAIKVVNNKSMRRRLQVVPFNNSLDADKQNVNLKSELEGEIHGIIAWLCKGLEMYASEGISKTSECPAVTEATAEYLDQVSDLGAFVKHSKESRTVNQNMVSKLIFDTAYREYCAENSIDYPGKKLITKEMASLGYQVKRTNRGNKYIGVALKDSVFNAAKSICDAEKVKRLRQRA